MELLKLVCIFATWFAIVSGAEVKFEGCTGIRLKSHNTDEIIVCDGIPGLQDLSRFARPGAKVTQLSSYNSKFTVLEDHLLFKVNLFELQIVKFCSGRIRKINEGAFMGGNTIDELDLTDNEIDSLDVSVFMYLPNLERLHLARNKLKQFADTAVIQNEKLQEFSLAGNQIKKLDQMLFSKVKQLSVLDLHENQLKTLDIKIFNQTLTNILHVSLYKNPWECNCEFLRMMELLKEKENLNLVSCSSKRTVINVFDLMHLKWGKMSKSCTPEIINPQQTDAESNHHLFWILLSILLVIGFSGLAGIGFWIKKRTVMENGRVKFVTGTESLKM